jgi:hypothetical protein
MHCRPPPHTHTHTLQPTGILYAFQEQTVEDVVMLNGFGTVVNSLGVRAKDYIPQICGEFT